MHSPIASTRGDIGIDVANGEVNVPRSGGNSGSTSGGGHPRGVDGHRHLHRHRCESSQMGRDDGHPRMDITSFVGKPLEQDDVDALREGVKVLAQAVMATEVSGQIGAAPYERSSERITYRNGYGSRG
jgi:Transposase, Mutator family